MKELIKTISKKEWKFVAFMAVLLIIITGVPYVYGHFATEPGTTYNGLHAFSPGDIPVYYSYMNQVMEGDFFPKNLFTSEAQDIGTFNVWWTLVALLSKLLGGSVILGFQVARLLMIPVFMVTAYLFISYVITDSFKRRFTLFFLTFSGGLGFYFATGIQALNIKDSTYYSWPIDLWLTEAITFNTLFQTSHFIGSICLTLLIFLLMLLSFEHKRASYAIISGLLGLFYFNFHPYYVPLIYGSLGLYWLVKMFQAKKFLWRYFGHLVILFILSVPSAVYHFWVISNSPVVAQRAVQNITNISPLIFVIIGYGFLLLGFLIGLYFLFRNKKINNGWLFLILWFISDVILIYSPFPFHSRYTHGLHFILALTTVFGLFELGKYLKTKLKPNWYELLVNNIVLLAFLGVLMFGTTFLYVMARDIYFFSVKPERIKTALYLPTDVFKANDWLKNQKDDGLVLASPLMSIFVPGFSGHPIYAAHGHETLFFYSKIIFVHWVYIDNQNDENKKNFLVKNNVKYIMHSDYEKQMGDFDPSVKEYLELVFDSEKAKIYRVIE